MTTTEPLQVRWLCVRHHGYVHRGSRPERRKADRLTEQVKFRIEAETLRDIRTLARAADRTVGQELRRALRLYILGRLHEPESSEEAPT